MHAVFNAPFTLVIIQNNAQYALFKICIFFCILFYVFRIFFSLFHIYNNHKLLLFVVATIHSTLCVKQR